jgi:pre-rRNA-processing protein TSR3
LEPVPLHIIHLSQDDPKKCTARKLQRLGLAIIHEQIRRPPRRGFLLDPVAGTILGPDDVSSLKQGASIVALDCSWKRLDDSLAQVQKRAPNLEGRTLPVVLAANPVSWGKPGRLSTVEALAVSLVLVDRWDQAKEILRPFSFGDQFFKLNQQPLEAYAEAKSNAELVEIQWEFFDKP